MYTLYLGSKSPSRRMLLDQARIPYQVVAQDADETQCDWNQDLQEVTRAIARYKMEHVLLPAGTQADQLCFVLTADTLSKDNNGVISGKPVDKIDAIEKIKAARSGITTGTSFCLQRRIWHENTWMIDKQREEYVQAHYAFIVPDHWIDTYLENSSGLQGTQAIAIEEFGAQFLKEINGSYSAVVGLPLFQVRQALEELGFF